MPGVSGLEVLHQLRELAPRLPVVLSSGYDEREVEAELRHDLTEFLHKPYRHQEPLPDAGKNGQRAGERVELGVEYVSLAEKTHLCCA